MSKLTLYGDPISGNCLKGKWTAAYVGIDIDWVPLDILQGASRTEEFLAINPMGQVPALALGDGRVVTQSNAIMIYLAGLADSDLLPKDLFERTKVLQWLFWEQNAHEPYIASRRFRKAFKKMSDDEIDSEWLPRGYAALDYMEKTLDRSPYLSGNAITLADIAVVAYTRVADEGGFELDRYQNVRSWIARIESDLNIPPAERA